jgi:exosortase D (VPLPA-CTERM-specific)
MAEGFLHEFQGWAVFMVSAAIMLGEMALLNAIGKETGTWRQLFGIEFPAPSPTGAVIRRRKIPVSFMAASAVLLGFIVVSMAVPRPAEIVPVRTPFVEFPMRIADWQGRRDSLDAIFSDQLKHDDYLLANYADPAGAALNFYASWYNSQRKGEAVHSPLACLPGGGWQMHDFGQRELPDVAIGGRPLRVNRTVIELGNQRQLVYYWFQQRGRIIDNEFAVRWYLFWDAVTRHRTDGALVRLITPLPNTASEADADRRLTQFAARIAPILPRYVPE